MSARPKKVLVVGAGAAGMSCCDTLARHPDRFDVTLVESIDRCGGQAFSVPIDDKKHGANWLNQGVQGGSYIFKHTFYQFDKQGHDVTPVELQVSFGHGENFWSNVFPTKLVEKHQSEIKRFVKTIHYLRWIEALVMLIPLRVMLKMLLFSEDFINFMVLPGVALFLGTGNATPSVPFIILERLFTSPTYGMWYPGDEARLNSNLPPMVVFPEFSKFYGDWQKDLESKGVKIRLSTEVTRVIERNKHGVQVALMSTTKKNDAKAADPSPDDRLAEPYNEATQESIEEYDELVLCVLADTAKRLLGDTATWMERKVLGSAKFSDDITVTHCDTDYMQKRFMSFYDDKLAMSKLSGSDQDFSAELENGKKNFKPMYYIVPQDLSEPDTRVDMCFDCTNYQGQFPKTWPFEGHVFQTIFLNKKDEHRWTRDMIDKSKIIREDWWHQLCHSWTHYVFVVPFMSFLNNSKKSTRFAAAWTLVNAHETAIISGMSAAYNLGASYPKELQEEKLAWLSFRLYNLLAWRTWPTRGSNAKRGAGVKEAGANPNREHYKKKA